MKLEPKALEAAEAALQEMHFDSYGMIDEIAEAAITAYLSALSAHPCTTSPVVDHETANVDGKPNAVADIDALAYRFWSVHPREIDAYLVNNPMPKGYKGGGRAWFFACEMRAALGAAGEPVAWIRAGFLEELHREGTHSGVSTVLWLNETNPRKRHSKRIPLYLAPRAPEASPAVTDEMVAAACRAYNERQHGKGCPVWEEEYPPMRAAITAALRQHGKEPSDD